jgi:LPXTG-motif cell wall-anchored protein
MKIKLKLITVLVIIIILLFPIISLAITEVDNGIMKIYNPGNWGFEYDWLRAFDIKGYIEDSSDTSTLISSTFGNHGYHTFLNVNGAHGEMNGELTYSNTDELESKLQAMQYTAYDSSNEEQTIDGIKLKVQAQFINNGEQLQFVYTLKNTTSNSATISLATSADVQIDGDDSATIERLEDGSGVRLWTKEGRTGKPVQFVFYGKDVPGTTAIDNLWIGNWGYTYFKNMFCDNSETQKIENRDSAFAFSWVNRTINAGQTLTYTVLMEVGEINIPNTGITLDNNTKFYYKDVKINGTVIDKDLKDKITVHYVVDGTEYTLPTMSTDGTTKDFTLDLTSLNLSAVTPHTLKVWATDSTYCDSNVEERTFTITYLKEPEVSLSTTEWAKDVTFKITDTINETQWIDKYQYRLNDGTWTDCSKDTDIQIQESGNVKVDVRIKGTQTDDYSNIVTVNAKIDKVNPTTTKPTATKTTCSITLNLGQTDAHSGIDTSKTMYAIKKNGTWSEWQSSNTFTGLTHNTEYVVKTKAVDKVGNTSESEELSVKTDELLLGNLILKLNNANGNNYTENTWTNQNIYVATEERSTGATTKYKSKANSAQTIAETNQETTVTTDGTTTITLSVTDGTNTITSDVEHILKIDKVVPVINELSLDNEEWTKESKNITGKAIDALSGIIAYQFSNKADLTSSSSGWVNVAATNNEITQTKEISDNGKIYFYVKDAAGNIASVGIDTKIDSQGPVINFSRASGKTAINVTDTGAGIKSTQYAWTTENTEPTEWQNYSSAVTYSGSSMGKIYLWAKSTDNANNSTTSSSAFSTLKKPSIVSEDEFVNKNISFKITSETEDVDVLYQFKINDGEWQSITKDSTHTITDITDGTVNISARILDNAGRYSEVASKTVKVSIVETPQDNGNSDNSNNNPGTTSNDNNSGGTTTKTQTSATSSDKTTAVGKLPQTGESSFIIIVTVVALVGISFFLYKKVVFYKDIK